MTVEEARKKAIAAARAMKPCREPVFRAPHFLGRADMRAQIAENTRISNERQAIEAAANETRVEDATQEGTLARLDRIKQLRKNGSIGPEGFHRLTAAALGDIPDWPRETARAQTDRNYLGGGVSGTVRQSLFHRLTQETRIHLHPRFEPGITPTPPEPRCTGSLKEHGPLVERYRGSLLGGTSKGLMCDACYLYAEKLMADDAAVIREPQYRRWLREQPPSRAGLVPQSFGDERLGGIWAARGMR